MREVRPHIGGYLSEERFEKYGFVTLEREERKSVGGRHVWTDIAFATRTDLPVRAYKPRADPVYPWNEEMHWRAVLDTPWRTIAKVTQQLEGRATRTAEEIANDPWLIRERADLRLLRGAMHALFTGKQVSAGPYASQLTHGFGIRMLLLEMLAEPTFDSVGRFAGFEAIDPQVAHEARLRLRGEGETPVERYRNFLRKNP